MKKPIVIILTLIVALGLFWLVIKPRLFKNGTPSVIENQPVQNSPVAITNNANSAPADKTTLTNTKLPNDFLPPLDRAAERVTKKPFGIHITPQNSPVQPEHFQGYHTGTDFEVFPEELNTEVAVRTICSGPLVLKETASGYGGVAVQSCDLNNQLITVVYGHLKLASITNSVGDQLGTGSKLGILGAGFSTETDGERKHLHLGIHRGSEVNIRGYVSTQSELAGWIDPCQYVCYNGQK